MKKIIVFILLLTVTGCDWLEEEFETVSPDQLNELKCEWQDPEASQWFYAGTQGDYHRLVHRDLRGDKFYQIKSSEFEVDKHVHFSSNEAYWIRLPWRATDKACQQ